MFSRNGVRNTEINADPTTGCVASVQAKIDFKPFLVKCNISTLAEIPLHITRNSPVFSYLIWVCLTRNTLQLLFNILYLWLPVTISNNYLPRRWDKWRAREGERERGRKNRIIYKIVCKQFLIIQLMV